MLFWNQKILLSTIKKNNSEQNPRRKTSMEYLEKRGNPDLQDKQETQMRGTKMKGPQMQEAQTQKSTISINDLILPVRRPTPKRRHTF